jgi:glycosyltransferase involved in cell wall biosynthesis
VGDQGGQIFRLDGSVNALFYFIKQLVAAKARPRSTPNWIPKDPNDGGAWAELLSTSPTIIQTLPTPGFPLGAASAVGPTLRRRRAHFLLMLSWTLETPGSSEALAQIAASYLSDHRRHKVTFLCNTKRETELLRREGRAATTINHNCLVNDAVFKPLPGVEPIYDAVYNARLSPFKHHELTKEIGKLALIYFYYAPGGSPAEFHAEHARLAAMMPNARFVNELTPDGCEWLSGEEVNRVLAQSKVGLCLSEVEGAMRASIEYLFAGLSVVSIPSLGGRDYFFDDEFCIICKPDPRSVREAIDALIARNVPRDYVRAKTLARVDLDRTRYINFVQELIDRRGGNMRFEDRFWELTRGENIMRWRSMREFSETVRQLVLGAKRGS